MTRMEYGSLWVAKVKELIIVLEFTSFQDTIMFHKRGRFGLEKVQNSEINVKVISDMEYRIYRWILVWKFEFKRNL